MPEASLLERAKKRVAHEDKVRELIRQGQAQKVTDSTYRIQMPDAVYFYSTEYVERIMDWDLAPATK